MQQYLFHNNGNGTFNECALESGVGLSADGKPLSGMGTAFQDYDNGAGQTSSSLNFPARSTGSTTMMEEDCLLTRV
jgi:hypothetical protein